MKFQASLAFAVTLAFSLVAGYHVASAGDLSDPASLNEKAPAVYQAKFDTSKGAFVIEVHRDWAPNGADRFYNLVKNGFYNDVRFFRVLDGFMAQFGINGNPSLSAVWRNANIKDDPVKQATRAARSPSPPPAQHAHAQVFINFGDNAGSTAKASPRSAKWCRAWMWSTRCMALRQGAPTARDRPGRVQSQATPIWKRPIPSSTTSRPRPSCNKPKTGRGGTSSWLNPTTPSSSTPPKAA